MSFLVNFRSPDGKVGYHPADSLEEAVRFVEHLRNQEQVPDARVWRLQEVPLEVRTYYKVEVATAAAEPPAPGRADDDGVRGEPVLAGATAEVPGAAANGANAAAGAAGPNAARFARFNRT